MNRDELIRQMLIAYWGEDLDAQMHKTRIRMAAALDIVLGEVLPYDSKMSLHSEVNHWISLQRARYSKVKTAEERVTMEAYPDIQNGTHWSTLKIDGHAVATVSNLHARALGDALIQQLKEGK